MAGVTVFHYTPGHSYFHKVDPRFKIGALLFTSLAVAGCRSMIGLILLSLMAGAAFGSSGLPLRRLVSELREVLFFLAVVFVVYAFTIPGSSRVSPWLPGLTREGIREGFLFGWRFILMLLTGLIFAGTTTPQNICDAVEVLLRPVPWLPATRIATMLSLIFVLTPLVLDETAEMLAAQNSRGVFLRKNPFYRIRCLAIPLCTRIFYRAEQLAEAMEARCYSAERTKPVFRAVGTDWALLFLAILLLIGALWAPV